jgi:hypothetical protein
MGDVGILDGLGRLWYCGRVSQRVRNRPETLFADQCEAIFQPTPDLRRSALVGVGPRGRQTPVLYIEVRNKLSPSTPSGCISTCCNWRRRTPLPAASAR